MNISIKARTDVIETEFANECEKRMGAESLKGLDKINAEKMQI